MSMGNTISLASAEYYEKKKKILRLLILVMCHSDKFIMETLKHYKWLHTSIENVALIRLNCKVLL